MLTALTSGLDPETTTSALARRVRFIFCSVADQVLVSGSNILLNIVLARWLTRPEFGAFAALFSTFTLIAGLHNALLLEPMSVLGGANFRHCLTTYTGHVLRMHAALVLACLPALILLGWALAPSGHSAAAFSTSLLGGMAAILLYYVLRRAAYVSQHYGRALVAGAASLSFALGCLYLIKTFGHLSWTTAFLAQSVAGAGAAALLYVRTSKPVRGSQPIQFRTTLLAHWKYGRWAVATAVVFWLSAEAYSVIVGRLLGSAELAGFRAVQNLSMLLPNFFTALSVLLLPRAANRYAETGPGGLRMPVLTLLLFSTGGAVVFSAVLLLQGERILGLLYGPGYAQFAALLPAMSCNLILITSSQAMQMGVRAMNAPRYIFEAFLLAALITCTVGVALTHICGLQGASVGLCLSTVSFVSVLSFRYHTLSRGTLVSGSAAPAFHVVFRRRNLPRILRPRFNTPA